MDLIASLRESWGWVGLNPSKIVAKNDLGNLIIEDSGGIFWRLCPEELTCEVVARSQTELEGLWLDPEFVEDWQMQVLVETARNALGELPTGKKYCMTIPAPLGGQYVVENLAIVPLDEVIGLSGDIAFQIKDLPDGAQVQLKVVGP